MHTIPLCISGLIIKAEALREANESSFEVATVVHIKPEENTRLSGLYKSSSMFCTQCEAEGFRRITYYLDRPDVMAPFRVRLEASKESCPILLSNGNKVDSGDSQVDPSRHWALWDDPFNKPAYLFALVAGDLGYISDTFTTKSGREVQLQIFSEHKNVGQLQHAMESVHRAMKWDEDVFGLEYDLDNYNIVAVGDFNMGAMENKGLNIFNTAYVLASPDTATDTDFERIESVIGHEYFHNWTGNRVTCRDWFQLTLKEGLTVFRDQQFSADCHSAAVKRIEDVKGLRSRQFAEDSGPMSHPIRPESYISMDNFYTSTVYEKGAEVVRMYHTLLGQEGFRKGMDLYFERHDGCAVTCDDFLAAMSDANETDLQQFAHWYSTAGTPKVIVTGQKYLPEERTFSITFSQSVPTNPNAPALFIPIVVGLLNRTDGSELLPSTVLHFTEKKQTFVIPGVGSKELGKMDVIASVLRGFSAPVNLEILRSDEDLAFLMTYEQDSFNRWEASQQLWTRSVLGICDCITASSLTLPPVSEHVLAAFKSLLRSGAEDPSLLAYALDLPDESTLAQVMVRKNTQFTDRLRAALLLRENEAESFSVCAFDRPFFTFPRIPAVLIRWWSTKPDITSSKALPTPAWANLRRSISAKMGLPAAAGASETSV